MILRQIDRGRAKKGPGLGDGSALGMAKRAKIGLLEQVRRVLPADPACQEPQKVMAMELHDLAEGVGLSVGH